MFGLQFLDVAIGVTFFFMLFSLVVTAAVEAFENLARMRGKYLEHGIRALLQDPSGEETAKRFYEHPLISGLYSTRPRSYGRRLWLNLKRRRLSFSERHLPPQVVQNGETHLLARKPSYIPADTFVDVVLDLLREAANLRDAAGTQPSQLVAALDASALDDRLKRALRPLLLEAGDDLEMARRRIEDWYYAAMDRVSGWYKRYAQRVAFVIGLVIAALLNADALFVVRQLSQDEALRQVFVAAAEAHAAQEARRAAEVDSLLQSERAVASGAVAAQDSLLAQIRVNRQQIQHNLDALKTLGLTLGWGEDNLGAARPQQPGLMDDAGWFFFKALGILLTAVAVSLGAPFWFDVLNKVMAVRATVKPREKSMPEASNDRQRPSGESSPKG